MSLYLSLSFVMSCLLINLNKCLKGHKSLGLLLGGVLKMSLIVSGVRGTKGQGHLLSCSGQLKIGPVYKNSALTKLVRNHRSARPNTKLFTTPVSWHTVREFVARIQGLLVPPSLLQPKHPQVAVCVKCFCKEGEVGYFLSARTQSKHQFEQKEQHFIN